MAKQTVRRRIDRARRPALTLMAAAVVVGPLCSARAAAPDPIVEDLLQRLEERDELIDDLLRRLERLEGRLDEVQGRPPPEAPAAPSPAPPAAAPAAAIDEEAVARALELTLIQEGAVLLPPWTVEIEPDVNYSHDRNVGLAIVTRDGATVIAEQDVRRDSLDATLGARLGLPWDLQVTAQVPFSYVRDRTTVAQGPEQIRTATGLGDIQLGLTKHLLRQQGWRPDVLTTVSWRAPTGGDPYDDTDDIAIGTGFHGLRGTFTAVRSQDPLVFFGTLYHTVNLPATKGIGRVDPGDTTGLRLGTVFAVNPDTSLRFAYEQSFTRRLEVDGTPVPGSDQVSGVLELGASSLLTRRSLVNFSLGIGVTRDAPAVQVGLSFPIRL